MAGIICLVCGDVGRQDAIIYCVNCPDFPVHRYCVLGFVTGPVRWFCDDCKKEPTSVLDFDKRSSKDSTS